MNTETWAAKVTWTSTDARVGRVEASLRVSGHSRGDLLETRREVFLDRLPLLACRRFTIQLHKPLQPVTESLEGHLDLLLGGGGWVMPVQREQCAGSES